MTPTESPPSRSFWQRRLGDPLLGLLKQGVSPDQLAATLAAGTAASLCPFFGTTTGLNVAVGWRFRMNQPLLQALNYLLTPVQLVMILVYVRSGEWLWDAPPMPFNLNDVLTTFRAAPLSEFFQRFGWAGVHAGTAWLLSVPVIVAGLYYPLRPLMRQLARLNRSKPRPPA
jgi:uncharacterized protein (DUF2062 family)